MFQGKSARFQAILTALEDPACRPLEQVGPQPVKSDLDLETFQEVHQELVTAGVDLAMKCMSAVGVADGDGGGGTDDGKESEASISPQLSLEGSLMEMSVEGECTRHTANICTFYTVNCKWLGNICMLCVMGTADGYQATFLACDGCC